MRKITAIRRGLALAMIAGAIGAVWTSVRNRKAPPPPSSPSSSTHGNGSPTRTDTNPTTADVRPVVGDGSPSRTAAPAMSTGAPTTWVSPNADGTAPDTHPIKANERSGIYHLPGGRSYNRTNPERCYATPADAEGDGYRPAKS